MDLIRSDLPGSEEQLVHAELVFVRVLSQQYTALHIESRVREDF